MKYILGVDTGNTNTVFGLFAPDGDFEILHHWRTVSRRDRTSDELGIFLIGFLQTAGIAVESIGGFLYSSVVPSFNPIVERMARDYFHCSALRVSHDLSMGLEYDYPRPDEIGADRLVNAVAAHTLYGGDLIVIDMGTATTFCKLHGNRYQGGCIAPGLKLSIEALWRNTAQLPPVEFVRPEAVTGHSTIKALQSGFYYGWIGLLKEVIAQLRAENPERSYRTVATGGLSALIQSDAQIFDVVDSLLTLRGLKAIYGKQS